MSESGTLKIHARVRPASAGSGKPTPITIDAPKLRGRRSRLSRGDRLLRNSAYACALLLGVLALGNLDQPWAKRASERVEQALTMRVDLDESIGALEFVRRLMPESALVFMNLSGETGLAMPAKGSVSHPWSNLQPWLMIDCADGEVRAAAAGTVTAVSPLSGGRVGVLVDHGEGVETLYAQLSAADVAPGDSVARGAPLGRVDGSLYFEYREAGEPRDPTAALGLG